MAAHRQADRHADARRAAHLVGEAVQGPGQPVHGGGEGEVRVRERAADQVAGVGAHVSPFVVTAPEARGCIRSPTPPPRDPHRQRNASTAFWGEKQPLPPCSQPSAALPQGSEPCTRCRPEWPGHIPGPCPVPGPRAGPSPRLLLPLPLPGPVPVDGEVEPHQLDELGVGVAQHVGEVVGPVKVGVDGPDAAALTVQVAVNLGGDARQLGDQVHGVLVDKLGQTAVRWSWGTASRHPPVPHRGPRPPRTSQYLTRLMPSA